MKIEKLFMTLLAGAIILFSGCNNDDDLVTYNVTVTKSDNGTAVADKATAEVGATVKLTATADDGFMFKKWTVESGDITLLPNVTANPVTFAMPANAVSVKAEFIEQETHSIYFAGFWTNYGYGPFAYTMVNGVQTDLLPPTERFDATPISMTVSSGKTYVVGSYFDSDGWSRACYWVDGVVTKLDGPVRGDEPEPDYAYAITVSDGKIYIAGSYYKYGKIVSCYWVDGVLNTLSDNSNAFAITVSEGKVYAAGYQAINNYSAITPGYWVDGVFTSLTVPDGATFQGGQTMDIVVVDKVYVMGTYMMNSKYYPCVWADGSRTDLTFDTSATLGAIGMSMAVYGGKVYVSGCSITDYRKGCYWADGVRTDLTVPAGMPYSEVYSIGVIDGKVYVGGRYYDSSLENRPCYWFNGERIDLDIPTGGTQASIMDMYISE